MTTHLRGVLLYTNWIFISSSYANSKHAFSPNPRTALHADVWAELVNSEDNIAGAPSRKRGRGHEDEEAVQKAPLGAFLLHVNTPQLSFPSPHYALQVTLASHGPPRGGIVCPVLVSRRAIRCWAWQRILQNCSTMLTQPYSRQGVAIYIAEEGVVYWYSI